MISYFTSTVFPSEAFDPMFDITVALMAFLGGVGTLTGPVIGALILEPLQQYTTLQFGTDGLDLILFGSLLLMVILLLPEGIVPSLAKLGVKIRASRVTSPAVAEAGAINDPDVLALEEGKNG
jgi:branched-chain amino acid transport system permease protein